MMRGPDQDPSCQDQTSQTTNAHFLKCIFQTVSECQQNWQANGQVPNEPELRASGRTNFVGGIAASRPHRRTDSTVRPTPGTIDKSLQKK